MDRKKNDSYEETHRKLVEAMQEACVRDDFDDYPDPDIDISFIYEDIDDDAEAENMPPETRKKRFSFTSRFNKVAAILVVLLLTGNILLLATNSNESYGHKGLLHRLSETMTGVVTDDDNPVGEDEVIEHYIITSDEGFGELEKKLQDLYVLEYITPGFKLAKVDIRVLGSGDRVIMYDYFHGNQYINVNMSYCIDNTQKVYSSKPIEIMEFNDKMIYVNFDAGDSTYSVDVIYEDCIIEINSSLDKEELVMIANKINRAH